MNARLEFRVETLERQVAWLERRLAGREPLLVQPQAPVPAAHVEPRESESRRIPVPDLTPVEPVEPRPQQTPPPDGALREPTPPVLPRPRRELEDLLGGRLLGLVGGLSVVLGIAFLVALAIDHGWIGEMARVGLAAGGSIALFAGGVWLYENKGQSQAALAMVGAAIAGLYLTLTAATVLYDIVPLSFALPLALGIGAVATAIAVRWNTRTVAALGVGGTLLAPALSEVLTTGAMVFLALASASAVGVLVWRRWPWLAVAASGITLAQVAVWATAGGTQVMELVIVLSVFAALNLGLALGYELRDATTSLEPSSALLVPFGALVLGALGYYGLPHGVGELAGGLWLVALAVAHAALGGLAFRLPRASHEIGLVLLGAAVVLGDVAFGLLGNGWVLSVGWAASAVGFAAVARHYTGRAELTYMTLGSQLALAIGNVLLFQAQTRLLVEGGDASPGAFAALMAVAVASFACARLVVDDGRWHARIVLDALSMAALAYVLAVSLDGSALLVAWAAACVALARAAQRFDDRVAGFGALGFLALLTGHVLMFEAPPSALVYGLDFPWAAALGLSLVAGCAVVCVRVDPTRTANERLALGAVTAVALLYLGSVVIVTLFQPGPGAIDTGIGVDIRQQGQALLSAFWSLCGVSALWVGLRTDVRIVRLAGLALLTLAVAKVFLYDLSTLGSVYRVASFIALGLLLLTAAFSYQRMRATSLA